MESREQNVYEFSSFLFYPAAGELHIRGRVVRCPQQASLALEVLLRQAGEVVTREQLRAALWPDGDCLVYDDAINKAISYLRAILRDDSRTPKFIQTLPKRGYRFVAEVTLRHPEASAVAAPDVVPDVVSDAAPDVFEETSAAQTPADAPSSRPRRVWTIWGLVFSLLLCSGLGAAYWLHRRQAADNSYLRVGIAPFTVEGGDDDGLAESFRLDLTESLAQSPRLRVSANYAPRGGDDRQAMLALKADVLVFGRLRLHQGRVELQLELARGNDATHLAAFRYDVEQKDLLILRRQAQKDLLAALSTPRNGERAALGSTEDAQAYAIYLQARAHMQQWTPDGWRQSIDEFQQAIARDPGFANAYSGLSAALISMAEHGYGSIPQEYEQARRMAQKALELDPQLAEGHAVLGNIERSYDWNFAGAEQRFRRAIELDPAQSHYRIWLADLLCQQGRFADSVRQVNLAHSLDPTWKAPYLAAVYIFSSAGQHERGLEVGRQLLAMAPDDPLNHRQLGWLHWYMGNYEQAIEEWRYMAQLQKDATRLSLEDKGLQAYRRGGVKAYAELRLATIERDPRWQREQGDFVPSEWFVYAGQYDNAIAALSSQIDRHERAALQLAIDPAYEPLRKDARYQMLLRRMGMTSPQMLPRNGWRSVWE